MKEVDLAFSSSWVKERLATDAENRVLTLWSELLTDDDDIDEAVLLRRVREMYRTIDDD